MPLGFLLVEKKWVEANKVVSSYESEVEKKTFHIISSSSPTMIRPRSGSASLALNGR